MTDYLSRHGCAAAEAVLAAVSGMAVHAVAEGTTPGHLVLVLYEVADDRDLPDVAPGGRWDGWRMRALTGCMSGSARGPGCRR